MAAPCFLYCTIRYITSLDEPEEENVTVTSSDDDVMPIRCSVNPQGRISNKKDEDAGYNAGPRRYVTLWPLITPVPSVVLQ